MTVDAARPQSWGVARLSFGLPKNVGRAAIAPEKPRSTLNVEAIRSRWSQIINIQMKNKNPIKKYNDEPLRYIKKKYSCAQKLHISFVSLQYDFKSVANE